MKKAALAFLALAVNAPIHADAAPWDEPLPVKFGGFVDSYYAYDTRRPPNRDREFTTQPARHNEFNVNLAFIDAVVSGDLVRGRIALQAGNSVQSNYGGEPRVGAVSGPDLSRHIQEAVAGYRATDELWIDAGVFFSHIGIESWISRDNWTYSRSLMGDFSPYYQAGVKASYRFNPTWSGQLHVLNGWQNISENNDNKALGGQLAWTGPSGWSAAYNNFWGQEVGSRGRFFNDLIVKTPELGKLQMALSADYGIQRKPSGGNFSRWYAGTLIGRWKFSERTAGAARVERYVDQDQVIINTGGRGAFRTTGASVNLDKLLHKQLLWRLEARHLWCENPVFPARGGFAKRDGVVSTSLAMTF